MPAIEQLPTANTIDLERSTNTSTYTSMRSRSWNYFEDKSVCGFVGLSNQGATCYMNSLLQTLFMTPEFRMALYKWEYNPEKEGAPEESIPYQLQILFTHLQLSNRAFVDTTGLTKSFGWGIRDAFEQHDIQELNRVLFDALECAFKDTPSESLVNDLYQGTMVDQIICRECNNIVSRDDRFLDVPLVIRNVSSLIEALNLFVEPELLDGDNKYQCSKCDKKCPASKNLQFKELPYLLTLQLKRFDIDFQRMERIKLNNYVSFPRYLDMDEFVNPEKQKQKMEDALLRKSSEICVPTNSLSDSTSDDSETNFKPSFGGSNMTDSSKSNELQEEEPADELPPITPNLYELYSILIHSGSAGGGHYYAYIKSFKTRKWYKFNDSTVTPLGKGEIEKSFGGKSVGMWGLSSNAYMLVYRKVDPEKNITDVSNEITPPKLREMIEKENIEYEKEKIEYKKKLEEISLMIANGSQRVRVDTTRSTKLIDLMHNVSKIFNLENEMTEERLRLRCFDNQLNPGNDFANQWQKTLQQVGIRDNQILMIEIRDPEVPWKLWSPTEINIQVSVWNKTLNAGETAIRVAFERDITLGEWKHILAPLVNIPEERLRVFDISHDFVELKGDQKQMGSSFRIWSGCKLYVEDCPDDEQTGIQTWYRRTKDVITIKFNLPGKTDYNQEVLINQYDTLLDFKKTLQPIVGLDVNNFTVRRRYSVFSELKDLNQTLSKYGLSNNTVLHIDEGIPLTPDQYKFKFVIYRCGEFDPKETFEMAVSYMWTFDHLKDLLSERLKIPKDLIRLRDRQTFRLSKIHKVPDQTLKNGLTSVYDSRELVIQELAKPENLTDEDVVILMVRLYSQENRIGTPEEIIINKNITLWDLQNIIAERGEIPLENLSIAKLFTNQKIDFSSMRSVQWRKYLTKEKADVSVKVFFMQISDVDGFVYRDITEELPIGFSNNEVPYSQTAGGGYTGGTSTMGSFNRFPREERALTIKVAKLEKSKTSASDLSDNDTDNFDEELEDGEINLSENNQQSESENKHTLEMPD